LFLSSAGLLISRIVGTGVLTCIAC
jgi:hypothetical protein